MKSDVPAAQRSGAQIPPAQAPDAWSPEAQSPEAQSLDVWSPRAQRPGVPASEVSEPTGSSEEVLAYWRARARATAREVAMLRAQVASAEERIEWMREIGETMARRSAPHDAMELLIDRAVRMVGGGLGALYLRQESSDEIVARTFVGDRAEEIRLHLGEGLAGICAATQRVVNVKDASRDPRWSPAFDNATGVQTRSVICVPMVDSSRRLVGVVQVLNKMGAPYFTQEDEEMLLSISSSISLLWENFRYYFEQIASNMELLEARDRLEERVRQLDALSDLQSELAGALDHEEEVRVVARTALELLDADVVVVSFMDEGETRSYAVSAAAPDEVRETERGCTLFQRSLELCGPLIVHGDEVDGGAGQLAPAFEMGSYASAPLTAKDKVFGLIELGISSSRGHQFEDEATQLLGLIAGQLARSLVVVRERLRREREDRVTALGAMLSGVMHDLKTPLTISSGYLQLLERTDDEARRQEYSDAIKKQFEDIRVMTGEVVAYARGEITLYERHVHLSIFGEELRQSLEQEFAHGGSKVIVTMNTRGTIVVDEGKLKRIVFNLARNAREAMCDAPGVFEVEVSRDEDWLTLECRDTGPGIPTPLLAQVFEPFVSYRTGARSGLGLSIVRGLVRELGGEVQVASTVGVGTTFTLTLPWRSAPSESGEADHSDAGNALA